MSKHTLKDFTVGDIVVTDNGVAFKVTGVGVKRGQGGSLRWSEGYRWFAAPGGTNLVGEKLSRKPDGSYNGFPTGRKGGFTQVDDDRNGHMGEYIFAPARVAHLGEDEIMEALNAEKVQAQALADRKAAAEAAREAVKAQIIPVIEAALGRTPYIYAEVKLTPEQMLKVIEHVRAEALAERDTETVGADYGVAE